MNKELLKVLETLGREINKLESLVTSKDYTIEYLNKKIDELTEEKAKLEESK